MIRKEYDFVVVGGGLSGMCAAIAAARHGAKTALVQDRPVLGGNASSEIKMHICGADIHASKENVRETGIVEELLLTNRVQNPQHSFSVQDYAFESVVRAEGNIDLYLNTRVLTAKTEHGRIQSVTAVQMTTEKEFEFVGKFFADGTGDGFLGAIAGADFAYGRESRDTYGEPNAPEKADNQVMGASLMFTAKDMGRPVPFVKPEWAYSFTEEELAFRDHSYITSGYWWIEYNKEDMIGETETVRQELAKMLFGVWDHIKNTPGHGAENYALDWVGSLPGKRESRRLLGDYVLTENDLCTGAHFSDAVAYGGWSMDMHTGNGLLAVESEPTTYYLTDPVYQIPYRCLYSRNIENLFLAGRAISVSHMAFGSTRVMATCAVVGQAVGTACALCLQKGISPRALNTSVEELQQTLLLDDCFIPEFPLDGKGDLAKEAELSVSSTEGSHGKENVVAGYTRFCKGKANCWRSAGIAPKGEWLAMKWESPKNIGRIRLRFDSNCSKELTITISDYIRGNQREFPTELVKSFDVLFFLEGKEVKKIEKRDNFLRFCDVRFESVQADEVKLVFYDTYGEEKITLFGAGVFEK